MAGVAAASYGTVKRSGLNEYILISTLHPTRKPRAVQSSLHQHIMELWQCTNAKQKLFADTPSSSASSHTVASLTWTRGPNELGHNGVMVMMSERWFLQTAEWLMNIWNPLQSAVPL